MLDIKNLGNLNFFLILALASGAFNVFGLIYNSPFIFYGLIAFTYFYLAAVINIFIAKFPAESKNIKEWVEITLQIILLVTAGLLIYSF